MCSLWAEKNKNLTKFWFEFEKFCEIEKKVETKYMYYHTKIKEIKLEFCFGKSFERKDGRTN